MLLKSEILKMKGCLLIFTVVKSNLMNSINTPIKKLIKMEQINPFWFKIKLDRINKFNYSIKNKGLILKRPCNNCPFSSYCPFTLD